jgi:hypothetical protein
MRLFERLGLSSSVAAPPLVAAFPTAEEIVSRLGRPPVTPSADLMRIVSLPRRNLETSYTAADFAALEARLREPAGKCICASQGRPCPLTLKRIQSLALLEAALAGGLVAPIGVGHGKTLIDLLLPWVMESKVAVLLIPANLRTQLLERDWPYYGGHWKLPNLAGGGSAGQWFVPGRPVLHVLTYNKLSRPESSDLLRRIDADLVICDEGHNLKDPTSARTIRFLRHFDESRKAGRRVRLCVQTGTFASRSIKDGWHLSKEALGEGSPFPMFRQVAEEWSTALDPLEVIAPAGALERLCEPGESARDGFRRRRNDTLGVVSTHEATLGTSLVIRKREPGPVPDAILQHIEQAHAGVRPDGEEFVEQLPMVACARQLCAGFFHRWRYPRGEPEELILKWFGRRQEFNREMRDKLKRPREHLDSPGLLMKAAIRAYAEPAYHGDKPTWKALAWPDWYDIHDQVKPVTEAVWLDDFLIKDAVAWLHENIGVVWVEFPELGERIARAAKVPWYGGGKEASATIIHEKGDRSIVASIDAHGTGKNLQMFSCAYVATPRPDGWEQLIGRHHRPGQLADEVTIDVAQHTQDYRDAFAKARSYARFMQETDGQPQKLLLASYDW